MAFQMIAAITACLNLPRFGERSDCEITIPQHRRKLARATTFPHP